jgi:thymidylate synthase (FAD)
MVYREWHRHRTQGYSELSARYTQMPDLHYVPDAARVRAQSKKNKQDSDGEIDPAIVEEFLRRVEAEQRAIYETYEWALRNGIARETARINTPVSRYSRMRATANLRNWLGFLTLRTAPAAQWEIRQFANAVESLVRETFPRTWLLFNEERQRRSA